MINIQQLEEQHTSGVYAKRDLTITRGHGALLYDQDGNEYIDCVGGQGTANLGHTHPKIMEAIAAQARTLNICPEIFYNEQRARYLQRLTGLFPDMPRAFLCNSGTEANEAAIKFARYATGRVGIVAAMRGFHGRTFGSLSATWNKHYRDPFLPLVPGFSHVPYNDLARLDAAVDENTAAVLLEVVQGEGGVNPGDPEFLRGAQRICRERGALLVIDEVQTGFGRTGKLFAFMHYDLQPDLVTLGKSIAGGIPMGAVLLRDQIGRLPPGIHGSTFGGNPIACAAALATLDALEEERLPERAAELGQFLLSELEKIESPLVREARGLGLMIGIEIKKKVAPYLAVLAERGILALPAGMTVIRLLPPLVITDEQLDKVLAALHEVLAE